MWMLYVRKVGRDGVCVCVCGVCVGVCVCVCVCVCCVCVCACACECECVRECKQKSRLIFICRRKNYFNSQNPLTGHIF